MKHALAAAMLACISLQISCGSANAATQATAVRDDILKVDDRRMEALRRADPSPLQSIYADDYSLVTPSGVVRSKAEQIDDLKSGRVRYGKIETIERNVRIYGDVAIVLSREKYDMVQAGRQV